MRLFLTASLAAAAATFAAQADERDADPANEPVVHAAGYDLVGCAKRSVLWHDLYNLALFERDGGELIVMEVLHEGEMPDGLPDDWPPKLARTLDEDTIAQIDRAFALIRPQSRVEIAYLPGPDRTEIAVDGIALMVLPERATFDAISDMWFGEEPISKGLKAEILGGECALS